MPNTIFRNQVMTSEGAELLEKAKLTDDKITLSRLVLLPDAFDRSKCVSINLDFLKKNYNQYFQKAFDDSELQNSNDVVSVITPLSGSKSGITIQAENCCNSIGSLELASYTIKTICVLGYLKSEAESETQQSLCVFAVFSDDNSNFLYDSEPLSFSLGLCIDSEYIYIFGDDISPYVDASYVTAALSDYATKSDLNAKQETTVMDMDGSYSIIDGGFYHEITNSISQANYSVRKQNVPVSVDLVDNKLVLITQNGDKYTVTATVAKANVFDPVILTGYTNHNNPGTNSSLNGNSGSSPDLKYKLTDANGEYIAYNTALTYTVKGVYKADDTEETTTGSYILAKSSDNILCIAKINDGYSWTAARVEYSAE